VPYNGTKSNSFLETFVPRTPADIAALPNAGTTPEQAAEALAVQLEREDV
jgi:hypothetical protein